MREPFTFLHRFTFALFCDLGRRDPFLPISAALPLCVEKYAHSDLSFQPQSRRSPGGSARLVCQTKLTPAICDMYAQIHRWRRDTLGLPRLCRRALRACQPAPPRRAAPPGARPEQHAPARAFAPTPPEPPSAHLSRLCLDCWQAARARRRAGEVGGDRALVVTSQNAIGSREALPGRVG